MKRHNLAQLVAQKALKEDRYISQREIAMQSGVPRSTIIYWLNNPELSSFHLDTLEKLCKYLDCTADDLIEFEKESE